MKAMKVSIQISDPWDLGEAMRWQPLYGELIKSSTEHVGGRALIELDSGIVYRGSSWRYVIATPRHHGDDLAQLQIGNKVFCAITGISDEQAKSSLALSMDNWRDSLGFIGDVAPTS